MPTYEYRCKSCKHEFEEFQPITAEPIQDCPKCKKRKVERLIGGGAGIIFKGSGFYQTDYRSKGYQEAAKKDKPPESGKSEKSEKKDSSKGTSPKKENKSKPKSD